MSKTIQIKKGLDIKLKGKAEKTFSTMNIKHFALKPTDFIGVVPKLLVNIGDKVKAGTVVFFDKKHENIKFTAPVSGVITEVIRGEKRKCLKSELNLMAQILLSNLASSIFSRRVEIK